MTTTTNLPAVLPAAANAGAKAPAEIDKKARIEELLADFYDQHAEVTTAARTALEHAIKAGHCLNQIQPLIPHGQWMPWVKKNVTVKQGMANIYMKAASNADALGLNLQSISNLDWTITGFVRWSNQALEDASSPEPKKGKGRKKGTKAKKTKPNTKAKSNGDSARQTTSEPTDADDTDVYDEHEFATALALHYAIEYIDTLPEEDKPLGEREVMDEMLTALYPDWARDFRCEDDKVMPMRGDKAA